MKKYIKPELEETKVLLNEVILISIANGDVDNSIDFGDMDGMWQDWK